MLFFTVKPKKRVEIAQEIGENMENENMKNEHMKWIMMVILRCLPAEKTIDLIVKLLKEFASRTENQMDDALVDIVAEMLYSAFQLNKEQKMVELDQIG